MNYQEILEYDKQQKQKYLDLKKPYKDTEEQIKKLQAKIEKLKEKKEKQLNTFYKKEAKLNHHFKETILKPIAEEILKLHPEFKAYEILGCFGLNCECGLWFFESEADKNERNKVPLIKASLSFMPSQNGVKIWTGEVNNRYEKGSLGDLNGDNKVMEEVASIEQVNNYVIKSIQEKEVK